MWMAAIAFCYIDNGGMQCKIAETTKRYSSELECAAIIPPLANNIASVVYAFGGQMVVASGSCKETDEMLS
tara:strand:+ start:605 stop:817 length:213 start_codon:yes stop_codon:yes gene_type:complete